MADDPTGAYVTVAPTTAAKTDTAGKIAPRNIWFLMLYASNLLDDLLSDASTKRQHYEENPDDIFELIAEILTNVVAHRLRRNLTVELARRQDDLTRVRGRIDHMRTESHHLLQRGRIACVFDEFTADTQKNRLVRQALDKLSQTPGLKAEWRRLCRTYSEALERVGVGKDVTDPFGSGSPNSSITVGTVRNPEDQRMLAAAKLALYLRIPTEDEGTEYLALDRRHELWKLFENAVAGFYKVTFPEWDVQHGSKIVWQKDASSRGIDSILSNMYPDITIERTDPHTGKRSRMVIDTKFTEITKENQHNQDKLDNEHIFQLYTYLRSREKGACDDISRTSSGMLLYPSAGADVDEWFTTQGHVIRFATVDLSADNKDIRTRLIRLIQSNPGTARTLGTTS
ncbi:MAG: 5-methylcytosine-specific restriction endonuclease system specificity protein McrC [Candidatus Kaiserbacteria bacterium]|nr:5-methylcytosine-specific restriction endonuclease system specificity protein McrC [Candidatus Kaiserbacteria bacterium]